MDSMQDSDGARENPRAKNNQAQQRYRQRQKAKKEDLVAQLAELSKRLEKAQCTNETLADRNRALEHMAATESSMQGNEATMDARLDSSDSIEGLSEGQERSPGTILDFNVCFAEYINVVRRYKHPLRTPKDIVGHTMNPRQYHNLKQEFVYSVRAIMGESPELTKETQDELEEYVEATRRAKEGTMRCYTQPVKLLEGHTPGGIHSAPEIHPQSATLIGAMNLTKEQADMLRQIKVEHDMRMKSIRFQRQEISAEIRQINEATSANVYKGLKAADEANEEFSENLREEMKCMLDRGKACNKAVTPIQEALMILKGWQLGFFIEVWDAPSLIEEYTREQAGLGQGNDAPSSEPTSNNIIIQGHGTSLDAYTQLFAC